MLNPNKIKGPSKNENAENSAQNLRKSDACIRHCARAKFYLNADGTYRLASIQAFNTPRFREGGWEAVAKDDEEIDELLDGPEESEEGEASSVVGEYVNLERATRRARKNAFDIIMCNADMDVFVTFTYDPEKLDDASSYSECYGYLSTWLENRVRRRGLKYVCVPERTKKKNIHFHAIMNSTALKLCGAFSPYTSYPLTHNGKLLYNVIDWTRGFTSAEHITRLGSLDDERAAVSKYIFKYMGKQNGQKIGGRYVLIGGKVTRPVYVYGDTPDEFLPFGLDPVYKNVVNVDEDLTYREYGFI